jgi:hypothetical protein
MFVIGLVKMRVDRANLAYIGPGRVEDKGERILAFN